MSDHEQTSFTEPGAAKYLAVSPDVLRLWRTKKTHKGPRWYRAGDKLVRYRKCDLDKWVEARLSAECPPEAEPQVFAAQ